MWEDYLSPIPGSGKMFHSFLHPEEGYDAAAKQLQQAWQQAQQFQQPYNQAGQDQIGTLNSAQSNLLDPSTMLADWMSKYQQSPYAQKSFDNARNAGLDAASSQGLLGSSTAIQNIQNSAGDIMDKDRQGYLQDLMNKYMQGVGISQNMFNQGASSAGNLGQMGMNFGQNMAGTAFGAQNAPGDLLSQFLKLGAQGAMNYASGGATGALGQGAMQGGKFGAAGANMFGAR